MEHPGYQRAAELGRQWLFVMRRAHQLRLRRIDKRSILGQCYTDPVLNYKDL